MISSIESICINSSLFTDYTSWNKTNPLSCNLVGMVYVISSVDSWFCGNYASNMLYLLKIEHKEYSETEKEMICY